MNGVRIRIVDSAVQGIDQELPSGVEGEVAVSAPSMLEGYVRTPSDPSPVRHADGAIAGGTDDNVPLLETTDVRRNGYLLTGDLGRLDRKGRLTITGRTKLIVDVGGLKVNLLEVEAVLNEHPAVKACAVNAVPVSETVSRLKAFVVPACAELRPGREELRAFLRLRLSAHKVPRTFEIRDSLPRSATGKLLRHLL
jgi:acyl-CoA synthetase (AMP-forming)/AMP-acid ligase II